MWLLVVRLLVTAVAWRQAAAAGTDFIFIQHDAFEIETKADADASVASSLSGTCVHEDGLKLEHVVMANPNLFPTFTFSDCLRFCLVNHPDKPYVLISIYKAMLWGTQFNCICADAEALTNATKEEEMKCSVSCPNEPKYRCGDAKNDLLSAYCVHRSCLGKSSEAAICSQRRPHDPHGCVAAQNIDWREAHNVRNFSAAVDDATACVWECHDRHPHAVYSLTRRVSKTGSGLALLNWSDDVLTCSCGYALAFPPKEVVQQEFCAALTNQDSYYSLKCTNDLEDEHETDHITEGRCRSPYPIGCLFEELLPSAETRALSVVSPHASPDVSTCQKTCWAAYPLATLTAVRWDADSGTLHCFCVEPGVVNKSMLGPSKECDQECGYDGSGMFCGSSAKPDLSHHAAVSLYCIPDEPWNIFGNGSAIGNDSRRELENIRTALYRSKVAAEVMVGLITFLCLILISIVLYLCLSRGISSLSRQVM